MASYLDKIQKIPVKTRLIGFGVFIFLLIVLYVWQVYLPQRAEIEGLHKTLVSLRGKIAENDAKIKNLDQLKAEVVSLQQRLALLTQQLPTGSEVSGLLKQIQTLVNESGLVMKSWKPGPRKQDKSGVYEEIPIAMSLSGGYHNTASFFDHVGKLTRIVNILNIKMGGAKENRDGTISIDINCTAMTFAAVEKKVEPAKAGK